VDTNVLVYAVFPAMPEHAASRTLVDTAKATGADLCFAPQNLIEFYAVVTDPRRVTQPKSSDEALQAIDAQPASGFARAGSLSQVATMTAPFDYPLPRMPDVMALWAMRTTRVTDPSIGKRQREAANSLLASGYVKR
jgi:hypothetical protein